MGNQKIKTPPLQKCVCGAKPRIEDDFFFDGIGSFYRVRCESCEKQQTKFCSSYHRAVCKWNNKIKKLKSSGEEFETAREYHLIPANKPIPEDFRYSKHYLTDEMAGIVLSQGIWEPVLTKSQNKPS